MIMCMLVSGTKEGGQWGRGVAALSPRPQHDYYDHVHAGGCFVPASPTRNLLRGESQSQGAGASRARSPSETSQGTKPEALPGSSIIDGTTMVIFVRSSPPHISRSLRSHPYKKIQASVVGCGSGRRSFWNAPAGSADYPDATGEIAKLAGKFLGGWVSFQGGYRMIMGDFLFLIHNSIAEIVT